MENDDIKQSLMKYNLDNDLGLEDFRRQKKIEKQNK